MTSAAAATHTPRVGERVELARYVIPAGARVLYGQRIGGRVRVTDRPAEGAGRSYLIECGLEQDGYAALQALVSDYAAQSEARGEPAILVDLEHLTEAL